VRSDTRSIAVVTAIVLLLSVGFIAGRLAWSGGDASALVSVGQELRGPGPAPDGIVVKREIGFDGQFYFRLALDPFTTQKVDHGIRLDDPSRRQGRILFPLIAWILSAGGRPRVLLWTLIALNVLCLTLVGMGGALLARDAGRSPYAGLLFAGVPALLISLGFDTGECLAIGLLIATILLIRKTRFMWAVVALTLAAFTRETTLLLAVGLAAAAALSRIRRTEFSVRGHRVPTYTWLVPVVTYAAWAGLLWYRWGALPSVSHEGRTFGAPIVGIARALSIWRGRGQDFFTTQLLLLAATLAILIAGSVLLSRTGALLHERAAFVASAVLVLLTQKAIWFHYASFLRASAEMYVFALVLLLDSSTSLVPVGSVWAPVWGYLFARARTVG